MKTCRECRRSDVKFGAGRGVCYSCRGKARRGTSEAELERVRHHQPAWLPKPGDTNKAFFGSDRKPRPLPEARPAAFERTVVLFDVHIPDHDPVFWAVLQKWLGFVRPQHIVLGGDFADLESASQHGGNPNQPKVVEDVARVREAITQLLDHTEKITYLQGNHESRLARLIADIAPMLHGAVSFHDMLGLDDLGVKWVPEDQQPIQVGKCDVLHGHQIRGGGQYPARRLVEMYGQAGRTVMMGHVHKSQTVTKLMSPKAAAGMTFGCGRTLDPKWLGGPSGWIHEVGVIDVCPDGTTKVTRVDCNDGVIVWGGEVFR